MSKKPDAIELSNKERVRALLRDGFFVNRYNTALDQQIDRLDNELMKRVEEIRAKDPTCKRLEATMEGLKKLRSQQRDRHQKKLDSLRRQFFSKGLTPAVAKTIQDYADQVDREEADDA